MSDRTHALFEISWETCNPVGGIHTVLATKARRAVERYGDDYVAIGPWLLGESERAAFDEERGGFDAFRSAMAELGLEVRIGRWRIPGRPRTILVGFSGLYERKDDILAELWDRHGVDSLTGGWDYVEPLLFGHAAGLVVAHWARLVSDGARRGAVAHFHEWRTGSGLLHLRQEAPEIGTVFTAHATLLGRELAAQGRPTGDALAERDAFEWAEELELRAQHSLEGIVSRAADVFTTVSELTADEAAVLHERRAAPILPNGIDPEVVETLAGEPTREEARQRLQRLASSLLGEDVEEAVLLATGGRYELHVKGLDLLLRAAARLEDRAGRPVVLFVFMPAGHSGVRKEVEQRFLAPAAAWPAEPLGLTTHTLIEEEHDALTTTCTEVGLLNQPGARVRVVHLPIALDGSDGLVDLSYQAAIRAMDGSCFPSFYEPWGFTPMESLALGVPSVTSDRAGFGLWAQRAGLGPDDGLRVLAREGVADEDAEVALADALESMVERADDADLRAACKRAAERVSWGDLIQHYDEAVATALDAGRARRSKGRKRGLAPRAHPTTDAKRPNLVRFQVASRLPEALEGLRELAGNFWWSWDPQAPALFEELSPELWRRCGHNPIALLRDVDDEILAAKVDDERYRARLEATLTRFREELDARSDRLENAADAEISRQQPVAYFSLEFGVHESLRIYSGGLGILAGDHLKAASDRNLPLVGVGLFYRQGYVRQALTEDGDQLAYEEHNDPGALPLIPVRDLDGKPLRVSVTLPAGKVALRAWSVQVGRVPLYLLDADLEENREQDRALTERLYSGGPEERLRQEMLLGLGGIRLLSAMGLHPAALHLNEGHAAFASLERCAELVKREGLRFDEAAEIVRASTAFTTHTPVPAGHDVFGEDLIRRHFSNVEQWLGLPWERFLALGVDEDRDGAFNMTYLAAHMASFVNGVSRRHGEVSRTLLRPLWGGLLENEVPIDHVTNGVHLATWTHPALAGLLGAEDRAVRGEDFGRVQELEDDALWRHRAEARVRLLEEVRGRTERSFLARNDSPRLLARILDGLRDDALVIGFARRFAPYKRAQLLLRDRDRLRALLDHQERPVRILFAGKAHPADERGQAILKEIAQLARSDEFAGKLILLENYDADLARAMVQGVDVWLNTPTRPLEASGTSGMKAAANGALNLSVLDGWWIEGFDGQNGWALGERRVYPDQDLQDELDNGRLLGMLESELVPAFFERDADGLPVEWLRRVKGALASIPPVFDTWRMVGEYTDLAYRPLAQRGAALSAQGHALARALAEQHARVRRAWPNVSIRGARTNSLDALAAGDAVHLEVDVELAGLRPNEVRVELVLGLDTGEERLKHMATVALAPSSEAEGATTFAGEHRVERSGSYAYGLRVRARELQERDLGVGDLTLWA